VLEARDGHEALEIAAKHSGPIHLLLSDMVMPKMNGGDLAGRLKAICPKIRVAFMSGYSEFSRGEMGSEFPRAPVLQKPFSPASLVGIVREALAESTTDQSTKTIESRVT
jgi:YesN/AraC family two-component response regulator